MHADEGVPFHKGSSDAAGLLVLHARCCQISQHQHCTDVAFKRGSRICLNPSLRNSSCHVPAGARLAPQSHSRCDSYDLHSIHVTIWMLNFGNIACLGCQ
jgi:hypothetical protein